MTNLEALKQIAIDLGKSCVKEHPNKVTYVIFGRNGAQEKLFNPVENPVQLQEVRRYWKINLCRNKSTKLWFASPSDLGFDESWIGTGETIPLAVMACAIAIKQQEAV